jgi:1-acyl-sn-glycerol-3-phosphate acyltransferase
MRDLLRRQWHEWRLNLRPRELFYWLVQNLLFLVVKLRMRVQLYGGDHYLPPAPATLVLSGHKRDWDMLVLAPHLYYLRGWWRPDGRRMAFAGREDMFTPGFLVEIVGGWEWPRWAQYLFERISLRPIITPLRAYPILRVPQFSLRQYLFEVQREQGNLPLADVLSAEMLERLDRWGEALARRKRGTHPRPSRELRISEVLTWDYREMLMPYLRQRFLLPPRYREYKERQRQKLARQLQALADALTRGDTLWLAPEGRITPDGAVRHILSGTAQLLALAPPGTRVLPTNFSYDFMTTGRARACISIGEPLEGLAGLERAELGERVKTAIARQTVVTMSMLGSRFLWDRLQQGQPSFEEKTAYSALARKMQTLAAQPVILEQGLLRPGGLHKRLRSFLRYGCRVGLLTSGPDHTYQINPAPFQRQHTTFFWRNPRYCVNELAALEAALVGERSANVTQ